MSASTASAAIGADTVRFMLDEKAIEARSGESILQCAARHGVDIPHLCHADGLRPDGNCRACVCEVEGERTLAASCIRKPSEGMVVNSSGERVEKARAMVFELLATDMPARLDGPDPASKVWTWSEKVGVATSRYPHMGEGHHHTPYQAGLDLHDDSHAAKFALSVNR
jgi:formate dehydrogenase major subunit